MNFQQLRCVRAAVQNGLNLTEVANVLFTSQSGVSKQIKELETELGLEIFIRRGKRLIGLTKAGESVVKVIEDLLAGAENLKRLSLHYTQEDKGSLVIATTHNQARYALPQVLVRFARLFPQVKIELRQGTPKYVAEALIRGAADVGIATESIDLFPELETHECYSWCHRVVVEPGHPLTRLADPSLADIARYPIITYNPEFTGRSQIDAGFERAGVVPDIPLTAMDADVIKTYVRLGLGVGIVAEMAVSEHARNDLVALPASHFFERSVTRIAHLKGSLLRNYAYRLIEMFAPHFDHALSSGAARKATVTRADEILPFGAWLNLHAVSATALSRQTAEAGRTAS
jgi:DNA-binding transcriptional LysR family regulator